MENRIVERNLHQLKRRKKGVGYEVLQIQATRKTIFYREILLKFRVIDVSIRAPSSREVREFEFSRDLPYNMYLQCICQTYKVC